MSLCWTRTSGSIRLFWRGAWAKNGWPDLPWATPPWQEPFLLPVLFWCACLEGGVAHLGAVLVALESSTAVSTWLIKDTLAGFVALLVASMLCRLYTRPSRASTFALVLAMGMLAGIHFVAYISYLGAVPGLCLWFLRQKAWHKLGAFSLAAALSRASSTLLPCPRRSSNGPTR